MHVRGLQILGCAVLVATAAAADAVARERGAARQAAEPAPAEQPLSLSDLDGAAAAIGAAPKAAGPTPPIAARLGRTPILTESALAEPGGGDLNLPDNRPDMPLPALPDGLHVFPGDGLNAAFVVTQTANN